jgi:Na+/alanine symporter
MCGMIYVLLVLVMFAFTSIVLVWRVYETFRAAIGGRWRSSTIVALLAGGFVLLVMLGGLGDVNRLWEIPDATACSDQAEIVIEAVPGPAAGGLGDIEERDFLGCTAYWYR